MNDEYDYKNIFLEKDGIIIGLHAIGINGPYEYDLVNLDKSITSIQTDFMSIETWGNEYNENGDILGKGSFRLHEPDIEQYAKEMELDGWLRRFPIKGKT